MKVKNDRRAAAIAFLAGLLVPTATVGVGIDLLERVAVPELAFLGAWMLVLAVATAVGLALADAPPSVLVPAAGLGIATTHGVLPALVGYGGAVTVGLGVFALGALLLGTLGWFLWSRASGGDVVHSTPRRGDEAHSTARRGDAAHSIARWSEVVLAVAGAAVGASLVVAVDAAASSFQRAAWPGALALLVLLAGLVAGYVATRRGTVRVRALGLACALVPFLPALVVWDSRWYSYGQSTVELAVLVAVLAALGGLVGDRLRARGARPASLRGEA